MLRAFFFFPGGVFDAHRTVWYAGVANRQTSGRRADSEDAASRVTLKDAASVRGAAMAALQLVIVGTESSKFLSLDANGQSAVTEDLPTGVSGVLVPHVLARTPVNNNIHGW